MHHGRRATHGESTRVTPDEWWADTLVDVPAELDSPRWRSQMSDADVDGRNWNVLVSPTARQASERCGRS